MTKNETRKTSFLAAAAGGPASLRLQEAASLFFTLLPALLLAAFFLRSAELASGLQAGAPLAEKARIAAAALGLDLLSLARYLPVLFLCSLPFLLIRSGRARFWSLGLAWTLPLLTYASLLQYFLTARVPLGADLFAYTWADILTTAEGGLPLNWTVAAGLALALAALWLTLFFLNRRARPAVSPRAAAAVLAAALVVLAAAPQRPRYSGHGNEYNYELTLNKPAYFLDDSFAYLAPSWPGSSRPAAAGAGGGFHYLDPKYPFLHSEQTPDALGPYFQVRKGPPPNLVFIIVEGLGRSFSGPGAVLGSFTPQLDKLGARSLYWENFLATQGRTFGVLPSIFASLPFGDNGFAELGERMPPHISLLSALKANAYRLKVYAGFDADFDNDRLFYRLQGADSLVDVNNFGPGYTRSNVWGYADKDLLSRVLKGEAQDARQPFVTAFKTATMHTPYTFLGQPGYTAVFEKRLDELGIAENRKAAYREYRQIYTSILYLDSELGRFFAEAEKNPAYKNTVFIITGDHRLPEIPMASRIDRYHVPLIIFSPLLKGPARIKSVSSHLDLAPSLLAFLSANYGLKTPAAVTWLGSGLDMEPSFRNVHDLPLKQTKTNLVDFVSGTWYTNQGTLYKLSDGMAAEPSGDAAALARVQARFAAYRAANDQFARTLALMPPGAADKLAPYNAADRAAPPAPSADETSGPAGLVVREVNAPDEAKPGQLNLEAVFANSGPDATGAFVPLIVLLTADGRELTESYGPPQRLAAGGSVKLKLPVKTAGVAAGRYFLAVIPSDPDTGKSLGTGRYRIPVHLRD
jgi:uncharacterized sulfatase